MLTVQYSLRLVFSAVRLQRSRSLLFPQLGDNEIASERTGFRRVLLDRFLGRPVSRMNEPCSKHFQFP